MAQAVSTSQPPHRAPLFSPHIAVLFAGFLLTGVITALLGPLLPAIRSHYSITVEQAGRLFVAQFVGSSLGSLLSQLRLRLSVYVGLVLITCGIAAFPFTGWLMAPVAVFVFGCGLGLVIPATNMLVANSSGTSRASSLNLLNLFWGLGATASPLIVAALLNRFGYVGTLLFVSLLSGLVCIFFVVAKGGALTAPAHASSGPAQPLSRDYTVLFCAALFLYVGIESSIGGWTTTYVSTLASGSRWATSTVAVFWCALLAVRALVPLLLRVIGETELLLYSLVLAVVANIGLLSARSPLVALLSALLMGAGLAPVFALILTMLTRFSESSLASVRGWIFAVAGLGGAALPWLVGVIGARTGFIRYGLSITILALLILLALVVALAKAQHPTFQKSSP